MNIMEKMKVKVLDKGFVELVDIMGDDYRILQSARVSTGSNPKKGDTKDRGLIRYLYRNQHMTPFEQVTLTFHVKAPIFVVRQWFRHRTASYNEASARYKELPVEVFDPKEWRKQGTVNHQGSGQSITSQEILDNLNNEYQDVVNLEGDLYQKMLSQGISRELARLIMPVAQYTEFYETVSLRNLFHFLELRLHEHAQYEIRVYAEAIFKILKNQKELSWSIEIFNDMLKIDYLVQELKNLYKNGLSTLEKKLSLLKTP